MNLLRCLLFLQFIAVSAFGQPACEKPLDSSRPPGAMVDRLYRQVITHHPLGIPSGENWKIFGPYFGKSLLREIGLARSCQSDWARQTKGQMVKEPFAWGEYGFFSGDEELSEPSSFQISRTESNQDGSFRVYVRLSENAPNEKPWSWEVAVLVVKENKRFVIDDVIYLKEEAVGTENRLSEKLKRGCDGPHWVGYGNKTAKP